jgi:hypothetical protein
MHEAEPLFRAQVPKPVVNSSFRQKLSQNGALEGFLKLRLEPSIPDQNRVHLFRSDPAQTDDRAKSLSYESRPQEETRPDQRDEVHGPSLGRKTTIMAREAESAGVAPQWLTT